MEHLGRIKNIQANPSTLWDLGFGNYQLKYRHFFFNQKKNNKQPGDVFFNINCIPLKSTFLKSAISLAKSYSESVDCDYLIPSSFPVDSRHWRLGIVQSSSLFYARL